jgi:hypothetical protein
MPLIWREPLTPFIYLQLLHKSLTTIIILWFGFQHVIWTSSEINNGYLHLADGCNLRAAARERPWVRERRGPALEGFLKPEEVPVSPPSSWPSSSSPPPLPLSPVVVVVNVLNYSLLVDEGRPLEGSSTLLVDWSPPAPPGRRREQRSASGSSVAAASSFCLRSTFCRVHAMTKIKTVSINKWQVV